MTGEQFDMSSIAMLVFWGLIAALVIWLIYTLINYTSSSKSNYKKKNILEINEWRYRYGKISRQEYERTRKDFFSSSTLNQK